MPVQKSPRLALTSMWWPRHQAASTPPKLTPWLPTRGTGTSYLISTAESLSYTSSPLPHLPTACFFFFFFYFLQYSYLKTFLSCIDTSDTCIGTIFRLEFCQVVRTLSASLGADSHQRKTNGPAITHLIHFLYLIKTQQLSINKVFSFNLMWDVVLAF